MWTYTTPEIEDAERRYNIALQKLRIVRAPATVKKWEIELNSAHVALNSAREALTEARRAELATNDDEYLAKRLNSARAYSYECTMGDYSSGSISRAQRDLDDVLAVLAARGIDPKSIPSPSYSY